MIKLYFMNRSAKGRRTRFVGKHKTINNSIFKLMLVINKLRKQKTNVSQNKLKNKVE